MRRTSREPADVWVLRLSAITMATRPRCFERATAARTCTQNTSAVRAFRNPAIKPAIAPVHQAKAVDLPIISRCFDQSLPTSTLATPGPCEGRMKGHLHLILQIQVSAWQEREQRWHIGRKLTPQISLDQVMNGERFGYCGAC